MRHKLWTITLFTLLSALPAWGSGNIERTLAATAGDRLEVDLEAGGDLRISGWDRPEAHVVVRPGGRDQDNVRVEIDATAAGIRVQSRMIRKQRRNSTSFGYEIKVPERYDLRIQLSGGDIRIDGVEGEISGRTMGGVLDLRNLGGRLELSTMGGQVVLESSEVDGKVSTMGGDVELRDVIGDVDASTMGGDVSYHNVQRRQGSDAKVVKISTMGGRINVPDAPGGADLKTMGGEINVDRARGFVKADTMGGQITIQEIDGWVDAETMGGEVTVNMVGDPAQGRRDVKIKSMGGGILLTVPDGLSMRFDVEIEITKRAKRNYEILSDFPIEVSERKNGSKRVIVGGGSAGSGEHEIRIRTTNGNVEIRRGG